MFFLLPFFRLRGPPVNTKIENSTETKACKTKFNLSKAMYPARHKKIYARGNVARSFVLKIATSGNISRQSPMPGAKKRQELPKSNQIKTNSKDKQLQKVKIYSLCEKSEWEISEFFSKSQIQVREFQKSFLWGLEMTKFSWIGKENIRHHLEKVVEVEPKSRIVKRVLSKIWVWALMTS